MIIPLIFKSEEQLKKYLPEVNLFNPEEKYESASYIDIIRRTIPFRVRSYCGAYGYTKGYFLLPIKLHSMYARIYSGIKIMYLPIVIRCDCDIVDVFFSKIWFENIYKRTKWWWIGIIDDVIYDDIESVWRKTVEKAAYYEDYDAELEELYSVVRWKDGTKVHYLALQCWDTRTKEWINRFLVVELPLHDLKKELEDHFDRYFEREYYCSRKKCGYEYDEYD